MNQSACNYVVFNREELTDVLQEAQQWLKEENQSDITIWDLTTSFNPNIQYWMLTIYFVWSKQNDSE